MKKENRMRILPLLLILTMVVVMSTPMVSFAAQPTVNLGTTSSYAVLAGTGITNTGPTTINGDAGGDIGSNPTGTFVGQASVTTTGTIHLADAAAILAKTDLVTAYNDAAGRLPVTRIPTELGGTTLTPGVYDSADGKFQITGTLTLDALGDPNGVFVFKTASTLITAGASNVSLINSARYCRTFWQVGSSATLGVNSHFVGHIFALTSITATTGATVQGQLLARNGAVTLDTNTITNGLCATISPGSLSSEGNSNSSDVTRQAPLINVLKIPNPLVLTSGAGMITYTYKVTNPGNAPLSGISIVDDKLSDVNYVSGDINKDKKLQFGETWIYTATANLSETTTNSVTAKGTGNDITITDVAYATVVVTGNPADTVYPPPLINVVKIPKPLALISGPGTVVYTYSVTNPGVAPLNKVTVKDNKINLLNYVSGDLNNDKMLQSNETWTYTGKAKLKQTVTNTVTAKGEANGRTATDIAVATVIVTQPGIIHTIRGGVIPMTASPWYNILLGGLAMMLLGALGWKGSKGL